MSRLICYLPLTTKRHPTAGQDISPRVDPAGYWCDVLAEGLVCGTGQTARYVLGTFQTISPVLALRWLRGEARRIADRLDPDPQHSPWVQSFMCLPTVPVPDSPAELRVWCEDIDDQCAARERIKAGDPLFVLVPDTDCKYTLSVWPVRMPTRVPSWRQFAGVYATTRVRSPPRPD